MLRLNKVFWPLVLLWLIVGVMICHDTVRAEISAEKDADAAITSGYGWFHGIIVATDGTNAVTVDIYDSASATGRKLIPTTVITTSANDRVQAIGYGEEDVYYRLGIYVDITCAGTVGYMVVYNPKSGN